MSPESLSVNLIWGSVLAICKEAPGEIVPRPTSPVSKIVKTSVVPENKLTISADPLCIPTMAVFELLFALTSNRSTPVTFVSKVVVVPSTVKLLLTLKS